MESSSPFVSTCSRREWSARRSRSWRGRYLRWRESGGRWRLAGLLLTASPSLMVVTVLLAGAAAFIAGRGGI
jgi:hypothetical protein